jgi:hypothetical protein
MYEIAGIDKISPMVTMKIAKGRNSLGLNETEKQDRKEFRLMPEATSLQSTAGAGGRCGCRRYGAWTCATAESFTPEE